jgi:hypothetical protein
MSTRPRRDAALVAAGAFITAALIEIIRTAVQGYYPGLTRFSTYVPVAIAVALWLVAAVGLLMRRGFGWYVGVYAAGALIVHGGFTGIVHSPLAGPFLILGFVAGFGVLFASPRRHVTADHHVRYSYG